MGGGDPLQRLSPLENLALGCAAGVGTKLLNYPLLVWKNATQQGLPILLKPNLVYRGLPMACINLGGTTAVQFWFTGFFQKLVAGSDPLTPNKQMQAAFLAGVCSGVPCSVLELTMIQQQRYGGSLAGTPMQIVSTHGVAGLARGMISTMGREGLYTMAMLGVCPTLQTMLIEDYQVAPPVALASGAFSASLISCTISHPMDTIKTCMQGDMEQKKYTNIRETAGSLAKEYGVAQGLFKGLMWRVCLISTTFFLVNKIKQVIVPIAFPETKKQQLED